MLKKDDVIAEFFKNQNARLPLISVVSYPNSADSSAVLAKHSSKLARSNSKP